LILGPILYNESTVETIQYYGLQLVDFNISNKYTTVMSLQMKRHIKEWLIESCFKIDNKTPKFIKEKLTYLWVAIAKREYGECCKYNINGELLEVNQTNKSNSTTGQNDNQDNYQYSTKSGSKTDDPNNMRNDPPRQLQELSPQIQEMLNESWYDMDMHLTKLWEKGEESNMLGLKEMNLLIFRTLF